MGQRPTDEQLERRLVDVMSFMFLFRFVTNKDLGILGSSLLGVNDMRATLHLLLKRKWIASFKITIPVQAVGYYLLKDGLAKLPEAYLGYQYFFFPTRYKRSTFYHLAGVIVNCFLLCPVGLRERFLADHIFTTTMMHFI